MGSMFKGLTRLREVGVGDEQKPEGLGTRTRTNRGQGQTETRGVDEELTVDDAEEASKEPRRGRRARRVTFVTVKESELGEGDASSATPSGRRRNWGLQFIVAG
ncbi:hypothetical protein Ahy_A01g000515 isoform B [Arachis hypogaea]|uniref:Uncharacterized protein n=1 Tax=Arachis hypogaea TaxID=3818 RepID=A0A445EKC2_ARAHY|nr:hypothetical protein Ahy_A01g000515 isoform B [Arachis hypogaea]